MAACVRLLVLYHFNFHQAIPSKGKHRLVQKKNDYVEYIFKYTFVNVFLSHFFVRTDEPYFLIVYQIYMIF